MAFQVSGKFLREGEVVELKTPVPLAVPENVWNFNLGINEGALLLATLMLTKDGCLEFSAPQKAEVLRNGLPTYLKDQILMPSESMIEIRNPEPTQGFFVRAERSR